MRDSMIYRVLRWLNEGSRQTVIRGILWRWRAASEDRARLKQQVRGLEAEKGLKVRTESEISRLAALGQARVEKSLREREHSSGHPTVTDQLDHARNRAEARERNESH